MYRWARCIVQQVQHHVNRSSWKPSECDKLRLWLCRGYNWLLETIEVQRYSACCLSVRLACSLPYHCYHHHHHHCNAVILKIRNSAIADKPRDAFRGQSRSPNMVPFHVLGMVSYLCAIVTLSPRRAFFRYSTLKMPRPWYPGQRSLKVIESGTFDR